MLLAEEGRLDVDIKSKKSPYKVDIIQKQAEMELTSILRRKWVNFQFDLSVLRPFDADSKSIYLLRYQLRLKFFYNLNLKL